MLQDFVKKTNEIFATYDDLNSLISMAEDETDTSLLQDISDELEVFQDKFENLRTKTLLSGEYDSLNAIMTLHAGAGGTESNDWTGMLYRMYSRYCEKKGFAIKVLDYIDGDITGIAEVSFEVSGEYAYGYLKSEKGVHRLVRMSPYNAKGKRQTSFSSVDVMPVIEDTDDIEIADEDLKIDTYRSSGAGGQHINKTSSAVRITHIPTGIVTQCQNERSQLFNKEEALKMLKSQLKVLKEQEHAEKLSDIRGDVKEIGFGNQIRSYVMQPYKLVKDNRTGEETANVDSVLDGNLDNFINAYLRRDL
jgi:peptide chain release factor 2